jgi:hypothetical protein
LAGKHLRLNAPPRHHPVICPVSSSAAGLKSSVSNSHLQPRKQLPTTVSIPGTVGRIDCPKSPAVTSAWFQATTIDDPHQAPARRNHWFASVLPISTPRRGFTLFDLKIAFLYSSSVGSCAAAKAQHENQSMIGRDADRRYTPSCLRAGGLLGNRIACRLRWAGAGYEPHIAGGMAPGRHPTPSLIRAKQEIPQQS